MVVGRHPILTIADDINSDWLKFLPDEQNEGRTYRESELEISQQAYDELQQEKLKSDTSIGSLYDAVKRLLKYIQSKE